MVKVIVVEDEKLIREGLEQTVDWNKYDCDLIGMAVDGEDGERMIIEKKPDIVVTDIRMPKKNGLEMMRSVQEKSSAVFIILSGYDDFMYAKEAMSLGARGYLLKPIDDEEMEDILIKTVDEIKAGKYIHAHVTANRIQRNERIKNALCDKYMEKAIELIRQHYRTDLSLQQTADYLNISKSYLGKLFKNKTNYTFLDFLTLYRIKASVDLLEKSDLKIYEIAEAVGYADAKYFSRVFTKIVGVKPTEFRNGYRLAPDNLLNIIT